MTPDQQLQGQKLATQVAIEQRNAAQNEVIELRVQNTLLQAELAELKAAKEDPQPDGLGKRSAENGYG